MISARHPCMTVDGKEKVAFKKKRDAHAYVKKLAYRGQKDGKGHPNAAYRCEECGKYHLWSRPKRVKGVRKGAA